eukprot:CAMPEP_0194348118 /NCGR_PEP_ID=MMETSP0171-20130528/106359_1 /TAXON_ID=218684 /ORGANISM="Corethron pennatum, Strain L29A3" /LENGTH=57 /DNA_ID=CAMNT_0039115431 /DNA_START=794 /DNA_END=967 /DNA_ORIENTATION=+
MPLSFISLVLADNRGPEDGEGRKARKARNIVLVSGGVDALLQPFLDLPKSDALKPVE